MSVTDAPGWEKLTTAFEFRELMRKLITAEINRQRPVYQYGIVQGIDRDARKCYVSFDEEEPMPVKMGATEPKEIGQVVRVAGQMGDRYVDDIFGETYIPAPGTDPGYVSIGTFDAIGDLVIGAGDNVYVRLPRGSDGEALLSTATTVQWGTLAADNVSFTPYGGITATDVQDALAEVADAIAAAYDVASDALAAAATAQAAADTAQSDVNALESQVLPVAFFIGDSAPVSPPSKYFWVETNRAPGEGITIWVEDGD